MGQEIVYCFKCQNRLVGSDFERGKAFKIGTTNACYTCVLDLLGDHPDPEAERDRLKRDARTTSGSKITSSDLKAQRADAPPPSAPPGARRSPLAGPSAEKSPVVLYAGLGIAAIGVVLAIAVSSSQSASTPVTAESARGTSTSSRREEDPVLPVPSRNPERTLKDELRELDEKIRPLVEQGQIRDAAAVLDAIGGRHPEPDWTLGLASRMGTLETEGRRRTAVLFERGLAAARRGDQVQVQALRRQVEPQSTRSVLQEFDQAVSNVVVTPLPEVKGAAPPPPPAPVAAKTPSPVEIYEGEWIHAVSPASSRPLAPALQNLEKLAAAQTDPAAKKQALADLQDLTLVQDALGELPKLAPRLQKGQKLTLEFLGESGSIETLEGSVVSADPALITLLVEGDWYPIPVAEISGSTIGTLLSLRGEKRPGDARVAQVIAALDGRRTPELERYASLKREAASEDQEARRQYFAADALARVARTRGQAVGAFQKLLGREGVPFVVRNRRAIEERLADLRDFVFLAEDLQGAGSYLGALSPKGDPMWQTTSDAPGKGPSNYLEGEIQVQPTLSYQGWVYAGGCCQEVLGFGLQATGLSGPSAKNPREQCVAEPGGEEWIAPHLPSGLKKKHADHAGPKGADHWEWIPLGTLKFSGPGPKIVRLLSEQKGFAVGALVVSASRLAPPRESELKDVLKNRPPLEIKPTSQIYREIFRDVPGSLIADLTSNAKFREGRADMVGMVGALDSWNLGENYGTRMRGYVHPPVTGDYVFWIASDDEGEFWISADDSPARKVRILTFNQSVEQRRWDKFPNQKSAPVSLVAGRRYYVEVLHKQGNGPDHVAVGWTLPNGVQERPIPPARLSPWGVFPPRLAPRSKAASLASDAAATKTASVGGGGGQPFEEVPSPRRYLRGVRVSLRQDGYVASLLPLFSDSEGRGFGEKQGAEVEVVARAGYVVGGIIVSANDMVRGFKLVFMRPSGSRLLTADRYESDWFGFTTGPTVSLAGDGLPVIGIAGRAGAGIDSLSLITTEK